MKMESVKKVIEETLEQDKGKKIIIFPYGEVGQAVKRVLNDCYGIRETLIIDNYYTKYNLDIKPLDYLKTINSSAYTLIFAYAKESDALWNELKEKFPESAIHRYIEPRAVRKQTYPTKYGKYSYGPLCDHWLVDEVGAFCSFALGTDVVPNHAMDYISTHPFIYLDKRINDCLLQNYEDAKEEGWNLNGVQPKGKIKKLRKIKIGNDVWLGQNVMITNGADIGNGVVAGAGAVITKDVPDYAVVGGVPARIIRYRYNEEQIRQLNEIAWWNWSDDKIRECYEDFFDDVDTFIRKHIGDRLKQ